MAGVIRFAISYFLFKFVFLKFYKRLEIDLGPFAALLGLLKRNISPSPIGMISHWSGGSRS